MLYQDNRKTLFFLVFCFISSLLSAEVRYEYMPNKFIIISKDDEACTHLSFLSDSLKINDYVFQALAADAKVIFIDSFIVSDNSYLIVQFDYGSFGTHSSNKLVDLYILKIMKNKFHEIRNINLIDVSYDGKQKIYTSDKRLSFFCNHNKNQIVIFDEINGSMKDVEIIEIK